MPVPPFENYPATVDGPAWGFQAITPSDTVDLNPMLRSLRVGTDGTVRVAGRDGSPPVTFTCVAGEVLPGWIRRVYATGTTATGLVGYV
ncbi:spike base protein, RCAP_Rcc01079 family [Rubellimicrobium arenae]|uniref:spike base protein, RCAP_Rcc01079 family n=1 Tax=Rubellimicrobium arenae TaxID=2817372 RepID=UPI001FEF5D41|nr:hypothetical protein [Rubellimicrobium arenae]